MEDLKIKEQQQQTWQISENQTRMMEAMLQKPNEANITVTFPPNAVANPIGEFLDKAEGVTFLPNYWRYGITWKFFTRTGQIKRIRYFYS